MGGYFSKDYYTNEEKVGNLNELSTTPKFRILKDDPRSASLGIVRTPIQVCIIISFFNSDITSYTNVLTYYTYFVCVNTNLIKIYLGEQHG